MGVLSWQYVISERCDMYTIGLISTWDNDRLVGLQLQEPVTACDPSPTLLERELVRIFNERNELVEALEKAENMICEKCGNMNMRGCNNCEHNKENCASALLAKVKGGK